MPKEALNLLEEKGNTFSPLLFFFFFPGFINGRESKLKYWKQGLNFQFFIQNQHVRLEILLKKII